MVKKSKKLLLVMLTSFTAVAALTAVLVFGHNEQSIRGIADGEPYSVNLNRSLSSSELASGQALFKTQNSSNITFKFDSSKSSVTSSELVTLATGGYFYNETRLTGITKIEGSASGGSAKIYFGNDATILNEGSVSLDTSSSSFTINLENPVDFFKISDVSGSVTINSLKVAFDCSNSYDYLDAREVASGDLLYGSTLSGSLNSNHIVNAKCLDVANSSSGYSFSITMNANASGGWPAWYFAPKTTISASSFTLEMYVKGYNQEQLNMNVTDASNNALLKSGNRPITLTSDWTVFTVDINSSTLASGKSGTDIAKIKFSQNFGTVATERRVYIDQIRVLVPETPSRSNIEMCNYVRASTSQTAAGSTVFDTVHGTSTASKKLTFADTTGLTSTATGTYRVFATFDIAASLGSNNGIDVKNCTLSFDIKFSDEIANSPDGNKSRVTIDFTDSTGKASSSWFQMNGITSYGDGWYRYYRNLNGTGAISALSGNVGTIKLGFNGVYTGNQATAHIYLDNIALTAN